MNPLEEDMSRKTFGFAHKHSMWPKGTKVISAYEPIPVKCFNQFLGSFEPIFDPNSGVNMRWLTLTTEFYRKAAKIIPEIDEKFSGTGSLPPLIGPSRLAEQNPQ